MVVLTPHSHFGDKHIKVEYVDESVIMRDISTEYTKEIGTAVWIAVL